MKIKLKKGNVIRNKDGYKQVIFKERILNKNEEFICNRPHEDDDMSYCCRVDYCRCMQ